VVPYFIKKMEVDDVADGLSRKQKKKMREREKKKHQTLAGADEVSDVLAKDVDVEKTTEGVKKLSVEGIREEKEMSSHQPSLQDIEYIDYVDERQLPAVGVNVKHKYV
jgi:hypothetical protein